MRIAFTGSREWTSYPKAERIMMLIAGKYKPTHVIVGDAKGYDGYVREFFKGNVRLTVEYAAWNTLGKSAGHIRNGWILSHKPEMLFAFPGNTGTENCKTQARGLNIEVFEITQQMLDEGTLNV
jgi:hypothetical protein